MRKRRYYTLIQQEIDYSNTPIPTVHNIVATSRIEFNFEELDLVQIQKLLPFSFYDKKRFAAVTIRLSNPECTALLFSSGRLVITGARTWYESIFSSGCICDLLRDIYPDKIFHLVRCDIQNIVGHVELPIPAGGKLDLETMYQHLQLNCTYQRLLFPGLIYRPQNSPVVLLCFYSGRIVITGGKNLQDIFEGWANLWPVIRKFITDCKGQSSTAVDAPTASSSANPNKRKRTSIINNTTSKLELCASTRPVSSNPHSAASTANTAR
jgi:transcription initiation factor TFIID TATA-box-binding protein